MANNYYPSQCFYPIPLPFKQLWEMYRFRAGQAKGQGAVFVDDARLLCE